MFLDRCLWDGNSGILEIEIRAKFRFPETVETAMKNLSYGIEIEIGFIMDVERRDGRLDPTSQHQTVVDHVTATLL